MDPRVEAIYENGVFKPLGEVSLPEHFRVVSRIENEENRDPDNPEVIAEQQRAIAELDAILAPLPDNSPGDGLSSADHDQILYGWPRGS